MIIASDPNTNLVHHVFSDANNLSSCRADDIQLAITRAAAAAASSSCCPSAASGLVLIHSGVYIISKPVEMLSNVAIELDPDVLVQVKVDNVNEWPTDEPFPSYGQGQNYEGRRRRGIFWAKNRKNLSIRGASVVADSSSRFGAQEQDRGNGIIDGGGKVWWEARLARRESNITRGPLLEFEGCQNVGISNVVLRNSPFWTVHPIYCDNVYISNVSIYSPVDGSAPNTDGIDVDSSTNVVITHCHIETGDDCIAVKSGWDHHGRLVHRPSDSVSVSHCWLSSPRCAALACGSEMSGGVCNIEFSRCSIHRCKQAFHIKTAEGRGGQIKRLSISNCQISDTEIVLRLNAFYRGHPFDYKPDPLLPHPHISDITLQSIQLLSFPLSIIEARALPNMKFHNIRINQMQQTMSQQPTDCSQAAPSDCHQQHSEEGNSKLGPNLLSWLNIVSSPNYPQLVNIEDWNSIELYWDDQLISYENKNG